MTDMQASHRQNLRAGLGVFSELFPGGLGRRDDWGLLARLGWRGLVVLDLVAEGDLGFRLELLVVLVAHGLPDAHVVAVGEVERIVGDRVSGEPVLAVDLLAVGLKFREYLSLLAGGADATAIGLDDLEIPVVHPDQTGEVTIISFELLGLDGEDVAADFIHDLMAQVPDQILGQLIGGQHKRLDVLHVLQVFRSQRDLLERGNWRTRYLLGALALRAEDDVGDGFPAAGDAPCVVEFLNARGLMIGINLAGLGKLRLFGREFLDDLVNLGRGEFIGARSEERGGGQKQASEGAHISIIHLPIHLTKARWRGFPAFTGREAAWRWSPAACCWCPRRFGRSWRPDTVFRLDNLG